MQDRYELALDEMAANRSDIAMCANWLSVGLIQKFDCSTFFDHMCGTFLVPKPVILNAATNIFLSLSKWMWCAVLISFGLTGFCLTVFTRLSESFYVPKPPRRHMYATWGRSFFDVTAISLVQSISKVSKTHRWLVRLILGTYVLIQFAI